MNTTQPARNKNARLCLRPATPRDAGPLGFFCDALLRRDYFLRRGQLADMLRSPHHHVYVAELDRVLVGLAITTRGTRLVNLLVHPAYRELGIGRALVGATGAAEARVKLNMSTGDPRGFYRTLGFESCGPAPGKDHIEIMRRAVTCPAAAAERPATPPDGNLTRHAKRRAVH